MWTCRTPLIASAAGNLVNLSLDLFFVFIAGWGVVGSASAATIGQYVGLATILWILARKGVLRVSDLRTLPTSEELIPMAQAGFGLAFCIGAVMCSVLGATTMATGELQPLLHVQVVNDVIVYIVACTNQAVKGEAFAN